MYDPAGVQPTVITSRQNPWFKRLRAAAARHDDEIIIEGIKQIADSLHAGLAPIAIAVGESTRFDVPRGVLELRFTDDLIDAVSDTERGQGAVALFHRPERTLDSLEEIDGPLLILDGVQDPGNVGTMIRLAAAFDAVAVVLTQGCADPWSPKVIRSSSGTLFLVPVIRTARKEVITFCEERSLELFVAEADGSLGASKLPHRCALAFGSEGRGPSEELRVRARSVSIPMSPRVESLNVAAAAAILLARMFEARVSS